MNLGRLLAKYLTREEAEQLVAAQMRSADLFEALALDDKNKKEAKRFQKYARFLRRKAPEIEDERIRYRTTPLPEEEDDE